MVTRILVGWERDAPNRLAPGLGQYADTPSWSSPLPG